MERKQIWTDGNYLSLFNDGTMGISDGVGYSGDLEKEDVEKLYLALKIFFEIK